MLHFRKSDISEASRGAGVEERIKYTKQYTCKPKSLSIANADFDNIYNNADDFDCRTTFKSSHGIVSIVFK